MKRWRIYQRVILKAGLSAEGSDCRQKENIWSLTCKHLRVPCRWCTSTREIERERAGERESGREMKRERERKTRMGWWVDTHTHTDTNICMCNAFLYTHASHAYCIHVQCTALFFLLAFVCGVCSDNLISPSSSSFSFTYLYLCSNFLLPHWLPNEWRAWCCFLSVCPLPICHFLRRPLRFFFLSPQSQCWRAVAECEWEESVVPQTQRVRAIHFAILDAIHSGS